VCGLHAIKPRLQAAFLKMKGKATTVLSPGFLHNDLALALQILDGADVGPVSRCNHWLTWALSLRLAVAAKPRRDNPLQLTLMGRPFTIGPLDAAMTARLGQWIRFGAHVRTVLLRPPRTFLAWRECVQALQAGIIESRLVTTCRPSSASLCLFAMARAGILQLEVMPATGSCKVSVPFLEAQSLAELSRWFPNRCKWGGRFADTDDISVVMRSLGYGGRPELLTLWLRLATEVNTFISEAGICRIHGRDISHEDFRQAAIKLLQVDNIPPTPLQVLHSMSTRAPVY
jgi:hypothetical protein